MVTLIKATPRLIFVPFVSEFWFLRFLTRKGGGRRGCSSFLQWQCDEIKMRSAEAAAWHWFQISSHLQQKHGRKRIDHGCSESLSTTVKTATARVGGILPLCPRPSLARRWLSGIWLVSSSHRWPPCTTTGQHNFRGNYIRQRCFIRSHIFISQAPLGIDSLKYLPKSCLGFFLCL